MPELPEVEAARALIEATALGRTIESVDAPDAWYLKRGLTASALDAALPSRRFATARRRGKLLMLDTDGDGPVLGLHLGMSGRILVDGAAAGDPLIYASNEDLPHWRRFGVRFTGDGSLYVRDPRRLGAVELDPDEERLGPDARALAQPDLDRVVTRSRAPLKAVLMDQSRVAGLGNLLTDEALWRAGLDPARPANSLDRNERRRLHRSIHRTLTLTIERGGAHTGDHMDQRFPGGVCPKDGTPFVRRTVGGRTTYSCPEHQR